MQNHLIMKVLFTVLFSSLFLIGQAQNDCQPYLPSEEGSTWEQTHYSNKDKVTGRTTYEILKKTMAGDSLTFRIKAVYFDDKNEEVFENEFEAFCNSGIFEIDMSSKLNGETMSAYESMDVTMDATNFPIPSLDEAVGTSIADGILSVQVSMNEMNIFKMTIELTDRLVAARENLETPAGAFDCVKITQTVKTKMMFKLENTTSEWYAEGVGVVRSETYDKKGRLSEYTVLTAIDAK